MGDGYTSQTKSRGFKVSGAGPAIYQDVDHVTHRDTVEDLVCLGHEDEQRVLDRAER